MESLEQIIKKCETYKDVIKTLGWNINGTNYSKVKRLIIENNLDISHFLNRSDYMKKYNHDEKKEMCEILIENSTYSRASLKRRLIRESILEYKCSFCNNNGTWFGKKISLILDHINGVNNDNRLTNLRFLCPNCNATLETHCGGNIKNKKNKKEKKILTVTHHIEKNKKLRKTERPPLDTLINDINNLGYKGTGRKYGVSDNSIRKWVNVYKKLKMIQ
jgi:hypothetical protein